MESLFGAEVLVTICVTVIIMGGAALMTGSAIANTWRPFWQVVLYSVLLGFADRFFVWGLFGGELWSLSGYLLDTIYLFIVCALAYRLNQAHKMVTQYPWMYERNGPFGWRERASGDHSGP